MVDRQHPKYRTGDVDKIYFTANTKIGKIIVSTKKKAKAEFFPFVKNPKKRIIYQTKGDPRGLQVAFYVDSPDFCCISYKGLFMSIPEDDIDLLIHALTEFKEMQEVRINENLKYLEENKKRAEKNLKELVEE